VSERRPRRSDFATDGRYYTALLIWLDYRYDNQVDRARKFHKITQKEDGMPVKRETKPKAKTALDLAVDQELNDMFDRLGVGPRADAAQRARIVELIELPRGLEPDEQAEFDKYVARRDKRRRQSRRFAAAVDRRQAKHPDESRGAAQLAVITKQSEKRRQRDARRDEREAAAELAREQQRAEAAAQAVPEPASAPATPYTAPVTMPLDAELEAAPPRRRVPRYGIVMQTDQYGNRIE
jgi:hypothetical protein